MNQYKKDVLLLIVFGVILLASFYLDTLVGSTLTIEGDFARMFALAGQWGIYLFVFAVLGYAYAKNNKIFLPLSVSYAITFIMTYFIKFLILRPRPMGGFFDPSFPSAHASAAFVAIAFLQGKGRIIAIIIGVLIAISRVVGQAHYLSDVVAGAMLGYLIGMLCYDEREKIRQFLIPFSATRRK